MNEQAKAALHTIDEKAAYFTAISDAVWDDPELSLKEFHAAALYKNALRELGVHTEQGVVGADMQVSLINDGPVTVMLDSDEIVRKGATK